MKPYNLYQTVNQRWLRSIPDSWTTTRLRFLCDVGTGSGDTVNADPEGDYPFIVRSPTQLRATTFDNEGEAILTVGDGAVGEVFHHIREGRYLAHQRVYVLNNFRGIDSRFFFYYFSSLFHLMAKDGSARTTVDSVRRWMLTDMPVAVPPTADQHAIADFLDRETARIDTLIEEQQRLIELLRERRSAALSCAFNSGSASRLRYAIDFAQTGPFGTQLAATEYVHDTIPVVNPSHIVRGSITPDPAVGVTENKADELSRHRFKLGDIVLGRKGEVDKSALVEEREVGYVCGSDSMLLRPCSSTEPKYLWWFLQSPECHSQLRQWSVGSTVTGLNLGTISKISLPLPSPAEQRRISNYLEDQTSKIDTLIAETEKFIELSRERRAALITAAVTGQIDARDEVA